VAREFAAVENVPLWKDITPRVGVAYDVFGTGRTAVKFSLGRYVGKTGTDIAGANNPITTSVNSVTRTWGDTNRNLIPDCDLLNPDGNGECGPFSNRSFGQSNITTRYADDVLLGFGARNYTWDLAAEVNHELMPGLAVTAGYYRTVHGNFTATDNLVVTPADFDPFCVTAPLDARLPGGGGYQVCGLYDIKPELFGRVDNLVTQASNFGRQQRVANFGSVSVNTRFASGLTVGGGIDSGQVATDSCFVVDSPQQFLNCHIVTPVSAQTQVKLFGSNPMWAGVVVSGTLQNVPGPEIIASYPAPNSAVAPSLGRDLAACGGRAGCTATTSVPLIRPQTMFDGRRTQLDIRVSKGFQLGRRARLQANLDIYNALNGSSVLSLNTTYGPQWMQPAAQTTGNNAGGSAILAGRLVEFGGQLTF
jgi:hypothetical protein